MMGSITRLSGLLTINWVPVLEDGVMNGSCTDFSNDIKFVLTVDLVVEIGR